MTKSIRFKVGDDVHYLLGDPEAEYYRVIATREVPHMRNGGPHDGEPLYVDDDKDYIIVKFPLLPDRISPYVHVNDIELDPIN